jgi:hypothetical protein
MGRRITRNWKVHVVSSAKALTTNFGLRTDEMHKLCDEKIAWTYVEKALEPLRRERTQHSSYWVGKDRLKFWLVSQNEATNKIGGVVVGSIGPDPIFINTISTMIDLVCSTENHGALLVKAASMLSSQAGSQYVRLHALAEKIRYYQRLGFRRGVGYDMDRKQRKPPLTSTQFTATTLDSKKEKQMYNNNRLYIDAIGKYIYSYANHDNLFNGDYLMTLPLHHKKLPLQKYVTAIKTKRIRRFIPPRIWKNKVFPLTDMVTMTIH